MATVEGIDKLSRYFRQKIASVKGDVNKSVYVGYTAHYALYVHENLQAYHQNGQAKFLEQPARQLRPQMREIITKAVRSGKSLSEALMIAGKFLQQESQKLVPVDTGILRASAFTVLQ